MTGAVVTREREGGGATRTAKYQNMKGRFTYSDKEIKAALKLAETMLPFTAKVTVKRLVTVGRTKKTKEFTEERTFEGILTSQAYAILADRHDLPSLPTIFDRFDTWNNALKKAKVKSNPSRRDYYERISEEDMLAAIRACATKIGDLPSLTDYDKWRRDNSPDSPSSVLIRKRLGGWLKAMEMMELTRV